MKQQFCVAVTYLNWALLTGAIAFLAAKGYWGLVLAWLLVLPLAAWAYIRFFQGTSPSVGHRSWEGFRRHASPVVPPVGQREVTFYTVRGCPFGPLVKERLIALRRDMGFELKEIDLTFKPGVLISKAIHALPVVECGGWRVEGNATSEKLANLIAGSYPGEPVPGRLRVVRI